MDDMLDIPDKFEGVPRKRKYPYDEWFVGIVHRLNKGEHFNGDPTVVISACLRYAERRKFAAAAGICKDKNGQPGSIMIWGDPDRPRSKGRPKEVVDKFREADIILRK